MVSVGSDAMASEDKFLYHDIGNISAAIGGIRLCNAAGAQRMK